MGKMLFPVMFNVRLTERQAEGLKKISDAEEISMSDIVRELIKTRLAEE